MSCMLGNDNDKVKGSSASQSSKSPQSSQSLCSADKALECLRKVKKANSCCKRAWKKTPPKACSARCEARYTDCMYQQMDEDFCKNTLHINSCSAFRLQLLFPHTTHTVLKMHRYGRPEPNAICEAACIPTARMKILSNAHETPPNYQSHSLRGRTHK